MTQHRIKDVVRESRDVAAVTEEWRAIAPLWGKLAMPLS
jgi:hypothetical protein